MRSGGATRIHYLAFGRPTCISLPAIFSPRRVHAQEPGRALPARVRTRPGFGGGICARSGRAIASPRPVRLYTPASPSLSAGIPTGFESRVFDYGSDRTSSTGDIEAITQSVRVGCATTRQMVPAPDSPKSPSSEPFYRQPRVTGALAVVLVAFPRIFFSGAGAPQREASPTLNASCSRYRATCALNACGSADYPRVLATRWITLEISVYPAFVRSLNPYLILCLTLRYGGLDLA